jgi:hypothetical protein
VLHLPSRRNPPIKGTETIDPILRELQRRGKINYLAPNAVKHSAVPSLVREADIVVEQILTGSYGVAAVEAMAAGRSVVGFVGKETRRSLPLHLPIVDAPPDEFEAVITEMLLDRQPYVALAASGPGYVKEWHTGTASSRALVHFLSRCR